MLVKNAISRKKAIFISMPENRLMLKKRIDLLLLASQTFKLRLYRIDLFPYPFRY